ncbi:MAG: hypothetical protein ACFFD1_05690, partial [Candidatus Thorarchaeota archaeon]
IFKNFFSDLHLIYQDLRSLDDWNSFSSFRSSESLASINKLLSEVDFGSLNYNNKLFYSFLQFCIQEIEFFSSHWIDYISLSKWFLFFTNFFYPKSDYFLLDDQKILTQPYSELSSIFKELVNKTNDFLSYSFPSNSFFFHEYNVLNDFLSLLSLINEKIGGAFTNKEKTDFSTIISQINGNLSKLQYLLRKKSTLANFQWASDGKNNLNSFLKLNNISLSSDNFKDTMENVVNRLNQKILQVTFNVSENASYESLLSEITQRSYFSFSNQKSIIESELDHISNWLREKGLLKENILIPITIKNIIYFKPEYHKSPILVPIVSQQTIKGIKIFLPDSSDLSDKRPRLFTNEYFLRSWVIQNILPGTIFLRKQFEENHESFLISFRSDPSLKRWNIFTRIYLLQNDYYSDEKYRFFELWTLMKEFALLNACLDQFKGKNTSNIINGLSNLLHIDPVHLTRSFYEFYLKFFPNAISLYESLLLLDVQTILVSKNLPYQRFFDTLIRYYNFPFFILKEALAKLFSVDFSDTIASDRIRVLI